MTTDGSGKIYLTDYGLMSDGRSLFNVGNPRFPSTDHSLTDYHATDEWAWKRVVRPTGYINVYRAPIDIVDECHKQLWEPWNDEPRNVPNDAWTLVATYNTLWSNE